MIPSTKQKVRIPLDGTDSLEGVLHTPDNPLGAVLICHPHPGFGGTMKSHVVQAIAEAVAGSGLAALRFNFRGVGNSQGVAAGGEKEPEDVLAALSWLEDETTYPPHLVGYSFGAMMVLAALAQGGLARSVCCIGFPTALSTLTEDRLAAIRPLLSGPAPVRFISGSEDSFCDLAWLAANLSGSSTSMDTLAGEDHYFRETEEALALRVASFVMGNL